MPELPEVLTISRDFKKEIKDKEITAVNTLRDYKLLNEDLFNRYVVGSVVEDVVNVAKLITIPLSSGYYIATHLNMTGRLLWNKDDGYSRVVLTFDGGDKLHFSSVRLFEYFEVWDQNKINSYKEKYGKEILDSSLKLSEFISAMKKSNTYIKNNLLNQKLVSGIGNIYANDGLYMSKIHPKRKSHSISDEEFSKLLENLKIIIKEGLAHRGSTIDRYTDLYGNPGSHQDYFRVYGKKGEKCVVCGNPISFEKIQGRGTYFCSTCQSLESSGAQKSLF